MQTEETAGLGRRVKAGFLDPLVRHPSGVFGLRNRRTGQHLASRLEAAFDSRTRKRGLLGRDGLARGAGLVIAPSNSIHTFFMRFAIDLLFVLRNGEVTKVRHAVGPWRLSASPRAFAVIELEAGAAAAADVRVGDTVELVGPESESPGI